MKPGVFRGLSSSPSATAPRWSSGYALKSVPFGKYWRGRPFVLSFVPRCQGECGSQK